MSKTSTMRAQVLESPKAPLRAVSLPIPEPQGEQLLLKVLACGVCRTDLHIVDGELPPPHFPLILGHQIVATIAKLCPKAKRFKVGDRVGVPWLGGTCGNCRFCLSHRENLCDKALFTGYTLNGGFAEFCVANEKYCFPLSANDSAEHIAPLLCGGLIGFRALRMAGEAKRLGFYGFGSSAHILLQIAKHQGKEVYAFTRPGDIAAQALAKQLGAIWAGSSDEAPPVLLESALIFAPVGSLVPKALKAVDKGGSVICAGIHMSDIPSFPYALLYGERCLRSVTNLTRGDGEEFFKTISSFSLHTQTTAYPLEKANEALSDLRTGKITGSAVLILP